MKLLSWASFSDWVMRVGFSMVCAYHFVCGNVFLNVVDSDANGLERAGNVLLTPVHYLLNCREVIRDKEHPNTLRLEQKFDYTHNFGVKITGALLLSPVSLVVGPAVKGLSYLSNDVRTRHKEIVAWERSCSIQSNEDWYRSIGMAVDEILDPVSSKLYPRRPGDESNLKGDKECLKEVVALFKRHNIPFWVDCGTCLGVYRHEGVIPWDCDIDIAILQRDFDNVVHALNGLDSKRYTVQDWSGRDRPKSYLKIYDRKNNGFLDLYNFSIDSKTKSLCVILSNENSIFLPEYWKIRERRYIIPTPFSMVFPLRKANFDGIEVYVPNQIEKYLQMRYGENLDPVKVYNPKTGTYEKDLSHPYWKLSHVK